MDIVASFEAQMTIQYIDENVERPLKLRVPKGKYLFVVLKKICNFYSKRKKKYFYGFKKM